MTVGRILIGSKDQVYYLDSASEADGRALGQALRAANYLQDRGATVLLSKNGNGTTISLVVREGSWERPQNVAAVAQMIRQIARLVGGLPITLRLLDPKLNIKKEIPITNL